MSNQATGRKPIALALQGGGSHGAFTWGVLEALLRDGRFEIEKAGGSASAYVPDLPGCAATGATRAEAEREIRAAIRFHLDGLGEDGRPVPEPTSVVEHVEV